MNNDVTGILFLDVGNLYICIIFLRAFLVAKTDVQVHGFGLIYNHWCVIYYWYIHYVWIYEREKEREREGERDFNTFNLKKAVDFI